MANAGKRYDFEDLGAVAYAPTFTTIGAGEPLTPNAAVRATRDEMEAEL